MHPDPSSRFDSIAAPAVKKNRFYRWIIRPFIVLFALAAFAAALAAWLMPDSADYSPWRSIPENATLVVDVNGTESILARLIEDRCLDSLAKATTEIPGAERLRGCLELLQQYSSLNPLAKSLTQPRRAMLVFTDSPHPAVLVALPKAAVFFLAPFGWFSDSFRPADSENDTWRFIVRDGWLAASASEEALRVVMSGWGRQVDAFGDVPGSGSDYIALAYRPPGKEPPASAENSFLVADPFAEPAAPAPERQGVFESEKPLLAIAKPNRRGWDIHGVSGFDREAAHFAAGSGLTVPPGIADFGDAPAHGHLGIMIDLDPGTLSAAKRFGSEARPGSGHPWLELGKLWLEKGWLAHADGGFSLMASAAPDGNLPSVRLKWGIRGEPAEAAGDFAETFGLWVQSIRAPGGQPFAQTLRSAIDYVEYSDDGGRGGVLSPPVGLFSGLNLEWRFGGPERNVGEMALAERGTEIGGETPDFATRRNGGANGSAFSLAADWNATDAMLDKGVGIWRLFAPLTIDGKKRAEVDAKLKLARLFTACYPVGSLAAEAKEDTLAFHAAVRTAPDE